MGKAVRGRSAVSSGDRGNKASEKASRGMMVQGQLVGERRGNKIRNGEALLAHESAVRSESFDFSHFQPTMKQKYIMNNMRLYPIVIVDGVAGTGKTTTAIREALEMLRGGKINQVVFIKTPSESGDDKIGYLKGDADDKLEAHFVAMRSVFLQFMTPEKLADEERQGRILFTVPNFLQGQTLSKAVIIVDETQNLSPSTVKLVVERSGQGSSVVLLGDSNQQYAHDHREDGFKDFINRVTTLDGQVRKARREAFVVYHKLSQKDVKRSELAEYISEVYSDWIQETDITDIWSERLKELNYDRQPEIV